MIPKELTPELPVMHVTAIERQNHISIKDLSEFYMVPKSINYIYLFMVGFLNYGLVY